MSAELLGTRDIIGTFYEELEGTEVQPWVDNASMFFNSDQESETYNWLGMVPRMGQFKGNRDVDGLRTDGITVKNIVFDASIEVSVDELRRDKTPQIMVRIGDLADSATDHWNEHMSSLVENGEVTTSDFGASYDGFAFFHTAHVWGASGTYDNDLTPPMAASAPTPAEMKDGILQSIKAMFGFKDDKGRPMNRGMASVTLMVDTDLWDILLEALENPIILEAGESATNILTRLSGFAMIPQVNPYLPSGANKLYTLRNDGRVAPFIRQEEVAPHVMALDGTSEEAHKTRRHIYTVEAIRNVAYGYPQYGCLSTFT